MTSTAPQITTTQCDNGITVTVDPTDIGWVVSATDTETDELFVQFTATEEADALTLADNLIHADRSDIED